MTVTILVDRELRDRLERAAAESERCSSSRAV